MPAHYFYGWLKRWAGECLKLLKLSHQMGSSGTKVPNKEQTLRRPLQKALENPTLWGWIGHLMVNVQNTECKIKLIYPAVRHLDPGELPARSHDTSPEKGYKAVSVFPFVWGPWTCKEQSTFHEVPSSPGVANHDALLQGWPKTFECSSLRRCSAVYRRLIFCLAAHFSL